MKVKKKEGKKKKMGGKPLNAQPDPRSIHGGQRIAHYDYPGFEYPKSKLGKRKLKNLIDQGQSQNQGAMQYPDDYIEKMHVSKSNWLGRMERGRER